MYLADTLIGQRTKAQGASPSVSDGKTGQCLVIQDNYVNIILAMMVIKILIRAGDASQGYFTCP